MNQSFLNATDDLTTDLLEAGVVTWDDVVRSVQCFHYGRNKAKNDFSLVWYERKGTCSTKHAFLKQIADLNKLPNIELMLSFYVMNSTNTPEVGPVLEKYNIQSILEAHCYLKVNGVELDVTHVNSNFTRYKNDIIHTQIISPTDVVLNKVLWHKEKLEKWRLKHHVNISFDQLWLIREECIQQLEKQK